MRRAPPLRQPWHRETRLAARGCAASLRCGRVGGCGGSGSGGALGAGLQARRSIGEHLVRSTDRGRCSGRLRRGCGWRHRLLRSGHTRACHRLDRTSGVRGRLRSRRSEAAGACLVDRSAHVLDQRPQLLRVSGVSVRVHGLLRLSAARAGTPARELLPTSHRTINGSSLAMVLSFFGLAPPDGLQGRNWPRKRV